MTAIRAVENELNELIKRDEYIYIDFRTNW